MKPESGACCQIFFLIFTVAVAYEEAEDGAPGWGIAFLVVLVSLVPTLAAADGLTKAWAGSAVTGAISRSIESICFYGGEESEAERLEKLYVRVRQGFQSFATYKLLVDLSQLAFYFGLAPISMAMAAFVVRKGEPIRSWTPDSETTFYVPWPGSGHSLALTMPVQEVCCLPYYHVQQLHCGAVVPMKVAPYVEFENVDIYTPDGMRRGGPSP
eukprot:Skav228222  [mRNA]  locus=scaffold43:254224:263351:- [translate_table: standard]